MHLKRMLATLVRWLSVVVLVGAGGCQAVLGDFEVEEFVDPGLGAACNPNTFRCREKRLERCKDDRRGFELVMACESAATCDPTAGACRPCVANQLACNDGVLELCAGDAGWTSQGTCETAALCHVDETRTIGACAAPLCELGSFSCEGGWLLACATTRDRWDLVEYCGADERCDAAVAAASVVAGEPPHCAAAACGDSCPAAVCVPGTTRCSRDVPAVELCGTDGQWIIREGCTSHELCDADTGRCLPPACNPGDARCLGQVRQVCSDDQTRFDGVETCPDGTTCAPTGCQPGKCTEGEQRCNGLSFERCLGGEFVPENRCATRVLCSPDSGCIHPACGEELGRYECPTAGVLNSCKPGRDGYRETTCPAGTACDDKGGRCVQIP
jgi:hypothetical protein